ncbi:hypothetical protein AAZX31_20G216200 [Glycine max]|uniref:Carrier domain-containing protein n=1 Tax=Glycine max TaxID=3847 RepID=K7N562_SOYBN|nr:hypothetical protein JHK85_058078 [Glycine max]KRG92792.1 hypothetical protein GLYMA_20G230100v4 [Glycine max]
MATNTFTGALLSERCLRLNLNKRLPKESALVPVAFALCLKNDTMMNFVATLTLLVMGLEEEFGITVEEDSAQSIPIVQEAADLIEEIISKQSP